MINSDLEQAFLHRRSCRHAAAIIDAVAAGRDLPGVEREAEGLMVAWDELLESWLSTTEKAAVGIARAVESMERHGGSFPAGIARAVADAVGALTS